MQEEMTLDRRVEIRMADEAAKVLDKMLDYSTGSGTGIPAGIDGNVRYFFSAQEVQKGAIPDLQAPPIPDGWGAYAGEDGAVRYFRENGDQLTGSPRGIDEVWLAYRDRTDFFFKDHVTLLQAGDLITLHAVHADIHPWSITAKIELPTVSTDPNYVKIPIDSQWLYTGTGGFDQVSTANPVAPEWVNTRAHLGSGCQVSFLRPGRTPAFTPRRTWAERLALTTTEEPGAGEPTPVTQATFRVRYDKGLDGLTDGRLVEEGTEYDIVGVSRHGRRRWLDIQVRRAGAA